MNQRIFLLLAVFITFAFAKTQQTEKLTSPTHFSWDDYNNRTYLGLVHNQNFPFACNSGWAFSAIGMLQARIKRMRKGSTPDISLSTQVLLSCDTLDYGCLGGEPMNALRWIHRNNITDETCHAYKARGYTQGQKCNSEAKCQKCNVKGPCKSQQNSKIYGVFDYGTIGTQKDMMEEIQKYGPITCGISVTNQFKNYTKGIFADKSGIKGPNHYVLLYGWGEQNGTKFWFGRNSWGSSWGESGNFRIVKGENNLGIESLCYWGSPFDTWTDDIRNDTVPQLGQVQQKTERKITYTLPEFLTNSRSILTPHFCQSSWAFSTIQMIRDRIYRKTKGKVNVDFSIQTLLNCGLSKCQFQTDPFNALSYIHKYGIPQQSCQAYRGQHPVKQNCSAINNCATCSGTAFKSNCSAVTSFKRWKILQFGSISGQQSMMSQINNNGPIVCGIDKNSTVFINYQGGIMQELSISPKINHYVEVVGYGEENGNKYWIGRNVWGTAWGEEGFFRIKRGGNNLGIEKRCLWAHVNI